jgi:putative membrane protein
MEISRNCFRSRELLIAGAIVSALLASALSACSSRQQEPQTAPIAAPAPETAGPSPQDIRARSAAASARIAPEVSTRQNTATVLAQMHQANLMEVELAKIAREKGSTSAVRAYADQLVQDHTNLDQSVIAMAQQSGNLKAMHRAAHESADEKTVEQKLKSANGAKFDKLFLRQASADHQKLIRKLQQDREDASDDQLEAMIDKMLPILEQHKDLAKILMDKEQASGQANRTHG